MIDKLWLGVGCSENSVLKIETESHQSGAQAFSVTIVVTRNTTILGTWTALLKRGTCNFLALVARNTYTSALDLKQSEETLKMWLF